MILLLSLLHPDSEINKIGNKPEILLHCSKTKRCFNIFDQLCNEYISWNTKEWALRIFYGMLDQIEFNSFVL